MGSGDIFRAVAQALLGGVSGAGKVYLEELDTRRKLQEKLRDLVVAQELKQVDPLYQAKLALLQHRLGNGGASGRGGGRGEDNGSRRASADALTNLFTNPLPRGFGKTEGEREQLLAAQGAQQAGITQAQTQLPTVTASTTPPFVQKQAYRGLTIPELLSKHVRQKADAPLHKLRITALQNQLKEMRQSPSLIGLAPTATLTEIQTHPQYRSIEQQLQQLLNPGKSTDHFDTLIRELLADED